MEVKLLTGIPRSGTTLCCNLLNQCKNVLALHEPINPSKLSSTETNLGAKEVTEQIASLAKAIMLGQPIELGDKNNYTLDNPVGLKTNEQGLREQTSERGKVILPFSSENTLLVVKQNALFAALSNELKLTHSLIGIIRHPIEVLSSWMSIDLPVNRGRVPAGEKYDANLKAELTGISTELSTFDKQCIIYQWFLDRYRASNLRTLHYEEIIRSNGNTLYDAFDILPIDRPTLNLSIPNRAIADEIKEKLKEHHETLSILAENAGYERSETIARLLAL